MQHIIILSTKSSGSTALQNYFKLNFGFSTVKYTRHQEEETLYWTKVASVLELPQTPMYRSEVPFTQREAIKELNHFFSKNDLEHICCKKDTTEKQFQEYYFELIKANKGKFIEKSPHHLYNESNLLLINNFRKRYRNEIEFTIFGLTRHPQAVLYSAWIRWKFLPSKFQLEWDKSYRNLLEWKNELQIIVVKYEDMIKHPEIIEKVVLGLGKGSGQFKFRLGSIEKWKVDRKYGFNLQSNIVKLAENLGYDDFEANKSIQWEFYSLYQSLLLKIKKIGKRIIK